MNYYKDRFCKISQRTVNSLQYELTQHTSEPRFQQLSHEGSTTREAANRADETVVQLTSVVVAQSNQQLFQDTSLQQLIAIAELTVYRQIVLRTCSRSCSGSSSFCMKYASTPASTRLGR